MQSCRLLMEMKNEEVFLHTENVGMVEFATLCGALEQFCGMKALKNGNELDDVKLNMLDIHLAAMKSLEEQLIRERGEEDGERQTHDFQRKEDTGRNEEEFTGEGDTSS